MLKIIFYLYLVLLSVPVLADGCVTCKCGGVDCSADICPKGQCYQSSCNACPPPNQQKCGQTLCQCKQADAGLYCQSGNPGTACTPSGTCSNFCVNLPVDSCPY